MDSTLSCNATVPATTIAPLLCRLSRCEESEACCIEKARGVREQESEREGAGEGGERERGG